MGTRKKTPPQEDQLPDLSPTEWDIEDFLEEWAPQTAVVEIYRRKDDGSMPHLRRVDINILQADLYGYLRQHFGDGRYVLQFKNEQRRIVKKLTIDVEGGTQKPPAANGANPSSFHEQLILALIASQKPAPPLDMGTLLAGLGTMVAALKPNASDPAAMLSAMAATFQQLKPPAEGGVKQALELISAAKDLVPGSEPPDTWPGLLKEGITTVASVLKPNAQPSQQPATTVQVVPRIPETIPVPRVLNDNPVTEDSPEMLREKWLRAQLAFLKQKALAGKDVEFWVDYVLENQEEPGNQAILFAMDHGATFQHLLTFDPEIGKNPVLAGWFQQFYESLHAALNEVVDSTGTGGDAPNPGGDAKPSPQ